MSRSPLRRIVACVGGLLIAGAFAGGSAANQAAPASPSGGVPYTPFVTLTVSKGPTPGSFTLKADPSVAVRPPKSNLTWHIDQQPAGYYIEIEFAVVNGVTGPFPKDPAIKENTAPGRYSNKATAAKMFATKNSDQLADSFWKYTVFLRDAASENNAASPLDPIVIFK
jgi:hypothetical protein